MGRTVGQSCLAALWLYVSVLPVHASISREELGSRRFRFTYEARIIDIPPGARLLEMWIPLPREEGQEILDLRIEGTAPVTIGYTEKSGDRYAYMRLKNPESSAFLRHEVAVIRREISPPPGFLDNKSDLEAVDHQAFLPYLAAGRFVVINDEVRSISRREAGRIPTIVGKARALYDWVAGRMSYDKSGKGWGLGDIQYCLKVGKGNCTDFHTLFIALARAAGIPARWNIGFPIDYRAGAREGRPVKGYHCWAEFFLPGSGWIPVDVSEGDKHPEVRDYFFGRLSGNRILYTRGRGIALDQTDGAPLVNYFIYPYVLVDGKPHKKVETRFFYRDY